LPSRRYTEQSRKPQSATRLLIDAIRDGRARERNLAEKELKKK